MNYQLISNYYYSIYRERPERNKKLYKHQMDNLSTQRQKDTDQNSTRAIKQIPAAPQLRWSARLRHRDIQITNYCKLTRKQFTISEGSFTAISAITKEPLSNDRVQKWAIHFGCVQGFVFAGICYEKGFLQNAFLMWPWSNVGHGNYVICSSKFAYSHTDQKQNYKKNSFPFKNGDIVDFEYNPLEELFVCKKRGEDIAVYQFTIPKSEQKLWPCIYLVNTGDWLEIIDAS